MVPLIACQIIDIDKCNLSYIVTDLNRFSMSDFYRGLKGCHVLPVEYDANVP